MRTLRRLSVFMAGLAVCMVGVGGSAGFVGSAGVRQQAAPPVVVLHSTMVGANEVGHAGDPNASGSTVVVLFPNSGMVCYVIKVSGLSKRPTAAHIHIGAAGTAGPVVVPFPLFNGPNTFAGCTTADKTLIASIIANPSGYYTNVHDADFPAGAIRGQLSPLA